MEYLSGVVCHGLLDLFADSRFLLLRKTLIKQIAILLASVFMVSSAFASCTAPQNAIEAENCLPGTPSTQWSVDGAGDSTIQGFATDISVIPGQTINFKISTTASSYHIEIYRMGFYQGNGARLITTFTPTASLAQGQPACLQDSSTGLTDCGNWRLSASWAVPATSVSGIYFAHLVRNDNGGDSLVIFVVRNDSSHSAILFQTSDESWEAYNPYGGHSLYGDTGFNLNNRAYKVSYNRPLDVQNLEIQTQVFYAEYPMVRWLEENGYDVTYFTSIDAARSGTLIANHKIYLSVGHDEYWSAPKRESIQAALSSGVNLAFFSGNEAFWKTRWENSIDGSNTPYRTLVCYKETLGPNSNPSATAAVDPLDPPTWTGTWRDPSKSPPADGGQPENELTGQLFKVNGPGDDNTNLSIKVTSDDGKMRFWRNTAVAAQSAGQTHTLPAGTLGYEWDVEPDNGFRPAGVIDLSTATYSLTTDYLLDYGGLYGAGTATHRMSLYRAPSGALVFGAGTVQWTWGLDANHDGTGSAADPNMQQATVNLLADMGAQPATLQAGLVAASPSTDTTPPTSIITSPVAGSTIPNGSTFTVQGTASDVGGVVGGVEVSVDGGVTWHPATGRATWSYSWFVTGSGSIEVLSRAVDDSGNLESPPSGVSVNVSRICPCNIWGSGVAPTNTDAGADSPVELGVKFKADSDGTILGIRFYKASTNTGTHIGNLWSSSGTLLGSATFSGESSSGWQQVTFSTPVPITANTVYVASYHTNVGHYAADANYFSTNGFDNAPLHALKDGISGSNGAFSYGSSSTFPSTGFKANNYWVDVSYKPNSPLTAITIAPSNPTLVGGATQQFAATGSYADGSSQNITGQVTWSSSNTGVATINNAGLATSAAGGATTITAMQGSVSANTTLTVQPGPLAITTTSLPAGNVATAYATGLAASGGTAPYSWAVISGTLPPGLTLSSAGQISGTPTASATYTFIVQVSDGGSPQQNASKQLTITVAPASAIRTIWLSTAVPSTIDVGPDSSVELGVRFKSDVNGWINGVRFYKASTNTGTHVANLWTNNGSLLATATFTSETSSGWQQVNFSNPVPITANTTYVVSYHTTVGHYSADVGYFSSQGVDNIPLHALQDGAGGSNGIYNYGTGGFPNSSYKSTNYWIDVAFTAAPSVTSIAVSPATATVSAGETQQFSAVGTFTDGSTQDITNQVTWSSSNIAVAKINSVGLAVTQAGGPSTVTATQGAITGTAALTVLPTTLNIITTALPDAISGQPYSFVLSGVGGTAPYQWAAIGALPSGLTLSSAGVLSGTPSAAGTYNLTAQLTDGASPAQVATATLAINIVAGATTLSIWSQSTVPGTVDSGPDAAVELGVKFKADRNGYILGIRFYKATTNTGTHIANLWTAGGILVATAVFSGETASGWQQVNFSTPIPIAANTVYIASYHTNSGHYSVNQNYFAGAGVDNPPLHALQDGVSGSDGVYAYGSNSSFPNSGYLTSNYWVDIMFQ